MGGSARLRLVDNPRHIQRELAQLLEEQYGVVALSPPWLDDTAGNLGVAKCVNSRILLGPMLALRAVIIVGVFILGAAEQLHYIELYAMRSSSCGRIRG